VFVIWGFAIQDQLVAKLAEVARMIKSLVSTSPVLVVYLVAAGVKVSSSPA